MLITFHCLFLQNCNQIIFCASFSYNFSNCINPILAKRFVQLCLFSNFYFHIDVNECDQVRVCTNGECVNSEGSYGCRCHEGYDYDEENKMCLGNTRNCLAIFLIKVPVLLSM